MFRSSPRHPFSKFLILVLGGLVCIALGWSAHCYGLSPMIKRLWSPSFAVYTGGCTLLLLAAFYLLFDLLPLRPLAWPLVVVGMNSIAIYCMHILLFQWTSARLEMHLGWLAADLLPRVVRDPERIENIYKARHLIVCLAVGLTYWLICLYMYRRKIFVRI